jgi:hypothetical protein
VESPEATTMNRNTPAPVSEGITQLQRQLDQFRASRAARTKLPESLWQAAVELARQHGIYAVSHPLRLDYTRLKQRLGGTPNQPRKQNKQSGLAYPGPDGGADLR